MTALLIHIGYHKTGTTWLQKQVFSREDFGFCAPWRRQQVSDYFIGSDPLCFDPTAARAFYLPALEKARTERIVPVISHERLSGYPSSGGYDSKLIADRLAATFNEALILIVIREQQSLIRSWYRQYVRDGGTLCLQRFLRPPQPWLVRVPGFRFDFFCFDRLIAYYRRLFGPDRVRTLPFELLQRDHGQFLGNIFTFVGLRMPGQVSREPRNAGMGLPQAAVLRWANRFFSVNQLAPAGGIRLPGLHALIDRFGGVLDRVLPRGLQQRLEDGMRREIAQAVGDRYRESNRRTSELIGFDLRQYGYDC